MRFGLQRVGIIAVVAACVGVLIAVGTALACPFCSPPGPTLAEEMSQAEAVVIVKLLGPAPATADNDLPTSRFKIVKCLKGQDKLGKQTVLTILNVGDEPIGTRFFVVGDLDPDAEQPKLVWSRPIVVSTDAEQYLKKLRTLPDRGAQRLAYIMPFLEHRDAWLREDAYNEFAKTPYTEVCELKPYLNRDTLLKVITDREATVDLRRLYLTLLGICGTCDDLPLLEELIRTRDRDLKQSLDAVVGCYLALRGADGLPLIEQAVFKPGSAEPNDIYATVMALRFHGEEGKRIERARLAQSLRLLLDRPRLVELVIRDLARWGDWTAIESLAKLFETVQGDEVSVRVLIVQYLNACPLPAAKEQIAALEKIDPQAVKQGRSPFAVARRPAGSEVQKLKPERDGID